MKYTGTLYKSMMPLSEVVEYFYAVSHPANSHPYIYHLAPSLEMIVVLSFGSPVSCSFGTNTEMVEFQGKVLILGPLRQMLNYELKPGSDLLVIAFINDGFYRLTSSLEDDKLLDHLETIQHALTRIPDDQDRIDFLSECLTNLIYESESAAYPLLKSIDRIHNSAMNPVELIAEKAAVSERTIQLRFKKYAGYSSKELLRYLRFKKLLGWVFENRTSKIDWMDLVVRHGYHDQSHLIKDFKHYTGFSPNKVLRMCREGTLCLSKD